MTKTDKATAIVKLLKKGYSPKEVAKRLAVSYNYAWKLKTDLEKAVARAQEPEVEAKTVIQPSYDPEAGEYIVVEGAKSAQDVDAILNERGSRYGSYVETARVSQNIKRAMADSPNWGALPDDTKETLEMLALKIARLLNGDPEYVDNVIDIIGYTQLVLDRMNGKTEHGVSEQMEKPLWYTHVLRVAVNAG